MRGVFLLHYFSSLRGSWGSFQPHRNIDESAEVRVWFKLHIREASLPDYVLLISLTLFLLKTMNLCG